MIMAFFSLFVASLFKLSIMSVGQEVLVEVVDLEEDVGEVSRELDEVAEDVDELLASLDGHFASKDGLLWLSLAANLVLGLAILVLVALLFCGRRRKPEAKVKQEKKVRPKDVQMTLKNLAAEEPSAPSEPEWDDGDLNSIKVVADVEAFPKEDKEKKKKTSLRPSKQ